ncbi:MAG TPA: hypothetical protein VFV52_17950 [Bacilli bacterium]|nr:hypothetical protein [Bacilli bacterium]
MSILIRRAEAQDIPTIEALLQGANVNAGGIAENYSHFLLVEAEQITGDTMAKEAVGTVGLEVYEGRYGVMRSLVMKNDSWNARIGLELIRLFLAYAETTEIEELYLLTKSTAAFFIHMGFSTADRKSIPTSVAQSPHFSAYADENVTVMVKRLTSTSYPQAGVDSVSN